MRYVLSFGSTYAGSTPGFRHYKNADTLAAVTQPAIVEIGNGQYYFEEPWSSTTITSITYVATHDGSATGVEVEGVIQSDQVVAGSVTAGTGAGVNPWLWTAGQIINMAATEAGLSEVADPYASTDPKFVQLRTFLKSAGDEISKRRAWEVLVKECTITGDGTTTTFALPADFLRMKDESGWNRTSGQPFGNPLSSRGWQSLKAWAASISITVLYRMQQGRMVFYAAPTLNDSLVYEYVSRYWVASSGAALGDSYFPTASGDVVLLEPLMVMRLVKAKFRKAKGFPDADGDFADYEIAFEAAAGLEPAPVISLSGSRSGARFLNGGNLPDTGYGA